MSEDKANDHAAPDTKLETETPLYFSSDDLCVLMISHYQVAKQIPLNAPTKTWSFDWKSTREGGLVGVEVSRKIEGDPPAQEKPQQES